MDVRLINPFITATKTVFQMMLQTEVGVSKPKARATNESVSDVSAIIGLTGPATGSVALCFTRTVGCRVASTFAGATLTLDDPDFADALGELANMVAGQAKDHICGANVRLSLPRVIAGVNHRILDTHHTPVLVLPCETSLGRFTVESRHGDERCARGLGGRARCRCRVTWIDARCRRATDDA